MVLIFKICRFPGEVYWIFGFGYERYCLLGSFQLKKNGKCDEDIKIDFCKYNIISRM
jgi:hypothetical protein